MRTLMLLLLLLGVAMFHAELLAAVRAEVRRFGHLGENGDNTIWPDVLTMDEIHCLRCGFMVLKLHVDDIGATISSFCGVGTDAHQLDRPQGFEQLSELGFGDVQGDVADVDVRNLHEEVVPRVRGIANVEAGLKRNTFIQLVLRTDGFILVAEQDETKATAVTGMDIKHHLGAEDLAVATEDFTEGGIVDLRSKASHEQITAGLVVAIVVSSVVGLLIVAQAHVAVGIDT